MAEMPSFPEAWVQAVNLSGATAPGRPPSPSGPHAITWLRTPKLGVSFVILIQRLNP